MLCGMLALTGMFTPIQKPTYVGTKASGLKAGDTKSTAQPIRGIYVSGWVAGNDSRMNQLLQLISETDLNAVVVDVKNDFGRLTYRSSVGDVQRTGSDQTPTIPNIKQLIQKLHRNHIYTIGRVVVFKDPYLAKRQPQLAIRRQDGGVWNDGHGRPWIDPYHQEVWKYNINIAAEAAKLGFDEIQFDYVRFPEGITTKQVKFANANGWSRAEAIRRFLHQARPIIHRQGAKVSADVFGLVTSASDDMGIGQRWRSVGQEVDYISPMIYPSHYSSGIYGVRDPDMNPYAIVSHAVADAKKRNQAMMAGGVKPAQLRPWLQSFTATWVHPHMVYDRQAVKKQIKALHDQGVNDFLLWSAACKYNYR
ncbi:putative glycoside hydrolase (plasmid) [Paenibacillus cellulosilyticus]|nr:putative glycoside hydrolase [Paenibacillus cellulosilyticus]